MIRRRLLTICLSCAATLAAGAMLCAPWRSPNDVPLRHFDQSAIDAGWQVRAGSVATAQNGPQSDDVSISPDAQGRVAIANPDLNLSADRCPTATLTFASAESSQDISCIFAWRRAGDPNDYRVRCVRVDDPFAAVPRVRFAALDLPVHPAWKDRIRRIEWTLDGVSRPLQGMSLDVSAARAGETAAMLWRQWWHREPIGPAMINTIRAPHVLGYSPNALLALLFALAAGACGLIASARRDIRAATPATQRWIGVNPPSEPPAEAGGTARRAGSQTSIAVVLVSLVGVAWLLNDARWAWAQTRQYTADRDRFGGTHSADLEARLWPPAVARMAELARTHLPPGAVYAVIGGNLVTAAESPRDVRHYGDSRLRYLLAPRFVQVNLDPLQPNVPPQQARYLLVLDRRLVDLDAESGAVRAASWPTAARVADDSAAGILIARMNGA